MIKFVHPSQFIKGTSEWVLFKHGTVVARDRQTESEIDLKEWALEQLATVDYDTCKDFTTESLQNNYKLTYFVYEDILVFTRNNSDSNSDIDDDTNYQHGLYSRDCLRKDAAEPEIIDSKGAAA